jgi:ribosomal-protein-alanine N-acetyltransferase
MKYVLDGVETTRLRFRLLQPEDFDTWLHFFREPEAVQHWNVENPVPEELCRQWFEKAFFRYANNLGGMNVLVDKVSGAFVGQCGLLMQTVDGAEELEIGYSIMPTFWRSGFASEAARACRDYTFKMGLRDNLISIIHVDNIKSQAVAVNNGMQRGVRTVYAGNPVYIYRLHRTDWERLGSPSAYHFNPPG